MIWRTQKKNPWSYGNSLRVRSISLHNFHAHTAICSDSFLASTAAISNSWWSIARRYPQSRPRVRIYYIWPVTLLMQKWRGGGWWRMEWVGGGGGRCSRPTLHPLLAVVAYMYSRSTTDPHQLLTAPLPGAQMTAFPTFGGRKKKLGSSSSNHGHLNIEK